MEHIKELTNVMNRNPSEKIREELKDFANQSGGKIIQKISNKYKIYDPISNH